VTAVAKGQECPLYGTGIMFLTIGLENLLNPYAAFNILLCPLS